LVGLQPGVFDSDKRPGTISAYTCPDCNGPLWEIQDDDLTRYRCRVGHAFTAETMVEGLSNAVEEALWVALNTLEESAHILTKLASNARTRQHMYVVTDLERRAEEKRRHAHEIRHLLMNGSSLSNIDEANGNGKTDGHAPQPRAKAGGV
jgi:two-component system, chemotaxis family, protein-glutamate methylesterase/glutaminase